VQSWEHGGPTSIAEVDAALGAMLGPAADSGS
jgi:hypothetical protein